MNVLIMMTGRSVWGGFNSVWAMIRKYEFIPETVYILTTQDEREEASILKKMLEVLIRGYGLIPEILIEIIKGDEIKEISEKVRKIATGHKERGDKIALEVTPGHKIVVLGSVFAGWSKEIFDYIFYLYVESLFNAKRPYLLIPISTQHLHEIISEAR
ncbi:MAG: hypothetical protein NO474_04410 [Methanomassiliicoccales archaeon]|nr:hypothetical protein [Methanomassiliicoccales archaeon]